MVTTLKINNELKTVDLSQPIDISIEFSADEKNPLAWYLDQPVIEPVQLDDWVGSTVEGAADNFKNI
jgi:formylmethanofuran dehydrogenase subunit B